MWTRSRQFTVAALSVLAVFVAGCGGTASTPTSSPTATAPISQPTADPSETARQDLIQAAQKEGKVVVLLGSTNGYIRPVIEEFGKRFGINAVVGQGDENRIVAEQQAGKYTADVLTCSSTGALRTLLPTNAIVPIKDHFFFPDVLDTSLWFGGKHHYLDPEQKYIFAHSSIVQPPIQPLSINTSITTSEERASIKSVWDLLDPRWKGKMASTTPGTSSAGLNRPYLHPDVGPDWVRRFITEMDVTFSEDTRFFVNAISQGQVAVGVNIGGGPRRQLKELQDKGAPITFQTDFKEASVLTAVGPNPSICALRNPPSPSAAKLFMNWYVSNEGQMVNYTLPTEGVPFTFQSLRLDVPLNEKNDPDFARIPGKEYLSYGLDPAYIGPAREADKWAEDIYLSSGKGK